MSSQSTVAENFATRKANRKTGTCTWTSNNIFCEHRTIYSYGHHHALAIYLGSHEENGSERQWFIFNADRWGSSRTTPKHAAIVSRAIKRGRNKMITLSFSALRNAGIPPEALEITDILDATEPYYSSWLFHPYKTNVYQELSNSGQFEFTRMAYYSESAKTYGIKYEDITPTFVKQYEVPKQGEFRKTWEVIDEESGTVVGAIGVWHIVEAVLIEKEVEQFAQIDNNSRLVRIHKYLLCGVDEGNYFISDMPQPYAATVSAAFDRLKPNYIRDAERGGIPVFRQGEWFFKQRVRWDSEQQKYIPITVEDYRKSQGLTKKKFKELTERIALPRQTERSNVHMVKTLKNYTAFDEDVSTRFTEWKFTEGDSIVWGKVEHRTPQGRLSGEHKTIDLGDTLYTVYKNTEYGSFSSNGRVD